MKKVIKLKESDLQKIVKRVLIEQSIEPSPVCVSCVEDALGPKYSAKAMKIAAMLMEMEAPSMSDIATLLEGVDMTDAFIIGPKLLECGAKCMPSSGRYPMDEKIPTDDIDIKPNNSNW